MRLPGTYISPAETGFYYLQSRYYDPTICRFINADGFAFTGQGVLGCNMFAYCGNNPISRSDISGTLWKEVVDWFGEKIEKLLDFYEELDKPDIATTNGVYGSVTLGVFDISGTLEVANDLEGNIQIVSSVSFDITTTAAFSASAGTTGSIFFVPDTSYLCGDTYYMGGSVAIPIPDTPITGTGSLNVGQTSDGYWGVMYSKGIAPISATGAEFHGGYSYTHSWTPQYNIIDGIRKLIKGEG